MDPFLFIIIDCCNYALLAGLYGNVLNIDFVKPFVVIYTSKHHHHHVYESFTIYVCS